MKSGMTLSSMFSIRNPQHSPMVIGPKAKVMGRRPIQQPFAGARMKGAQCTVAPQYSSDLKYQESNTKTCEVDIYIYIFLIVKPFQYHGIIHKNLINKISLTLTLTGYFLLILHGGGGPNRPPLIHMLGGQIVQKKLTHTQISYKYRLTQKKSHT